MNKTKIAIGAVCLSLIGTSLFWGCATKNDKSDAKSSASSKQYAEKIDKSDTEKYYPERNPYLSAQIYGITHFNSAQTDAFPYAVKTGTFNIDLTKEKIISGGPVNIMTLNATVEGFMWVPSTTAVTYVDARDGKWQAVATLPIPGVKQYGDLKAFFSTTFTSVEQLTAETKKIFGNSPQDAITNGIYTLADKDNNVYINGGTTIYVIGLKDKSDPQKGLEVKRQKDFKDLLPSATFPGIGNLGVKLIGINMLYDGNLVVGSATGIVVIDREFEKKPEVFTIDKDQIVTNSLTVDEKGGIYIASGSLNAKSDGYLYKLVWKNGKLSTSEKDGAWKAAYDGGDWAPAIKSGTGTGSTPTLMGFRSDEDKLVVLTNGQNRMKVVAFWREEIPADFKPNPAFKSPRIVDQFQITAGQPSTAEWVQSEQSIVAGNGGVFVVNNVIPNGEKDKLIDVIANGPLIQSPVGVEMVKWDNKTHKWVAGWTRNDISSNNMVPAVSLKSNIVFASGYYKDKGWCVIGLDWNTGKTVTQINLGTTNFGNSAYAIMQFAANGDLLYNGIAGVFKIPLK